MADDVKVVPREKEPEEQKQKVPSQDELLARLATRLVGKTNRKGK